eukprot:92350-Pelagomonas_calceolata.AAC.5
MGVGVTGKLGSPLEEVGLSGAARVVSPLWRPSLLETIRQKKEEEEEAEGVGLVWFGPGQRLAVRFSTLICQHQGGLRSV